jgi:acyl-CoA:acyl-CoA alkyltransferase
MLYQNVCLEALAYSLPDEVVRSIEIESWLEPLYRRLRLPEGRLELMSGIAERRFWPPGTLPGRVSAETAGKALHAARLDKRHVGALVHGSVSRDYLEPATACGVHRRLRLPNECLVYDVSNACLGLLNGMVQVANMIELGQIRAGVVVGTESSRALVENTVRRLNDDTSLSRRDIKTAMASLTIGSGSAALVLCDRELSRTGNRLLGGVFRAHTEGCELCQSEGHEQMMNTDAETLLQEGVAAARAAFGEFLQTLDWQGDDVQKTFCHQVGKAHRKALFEAVGLDPAIDFTTVERLGNTGAVALPLTAAIGIEQGHLKRGDQVALLGIGSGINVVMLGVDWQRSQVPREDTLAGPHRVPARRAAATG